MEVEWMKSRWKETWGFFQATERRAHFRDMPDSVEDVAYQRVRVPTTNMFDNHGGTTGRFKWLTLTRCRESGGKRGWVKKNV